MEMLVNMLQTPLTLTAAIASETAVDCQTLAICACRFRKSGTMWVGPLAQQEFLHLKKWSTSKLTGVRLQRVQPSATRSGISTTTLSHTGTSPAWCLPSLVAVECPRSRWLHGATTHWHCKPRGTLLAMASKYVCVPSTLALSAGRAKSTVSAFFFW